MGEREMRDWLATADAIVDGYDSRIGLYEQFSGFFGLEPLRRHATSRSVRSRDPAYSATRGPQAVSSSSRTTC